MNKVAKLERDDNRAVSFLVEASRLYRETCPELSRFLMQRPQEAKERSIADSVSECRKCQQLKMQRCHLHRHGTTASSSLHRHSTSGSSSLRPPGDYPQTAVCQYCGQWLEPGNHRVRLRRKRRASARVQSVLRREARGRRLSLTQREMLRRFRTSCSTLMATCHGCNNTSRYSGVNRDFTSPFSRNQSTPGPGASAGRRQNKTPQTAGSRGATTSTPKSLGKDNKTPSRTPRASTSSTSSTPASTPSSSSSKVKKWVVQRLSKILGREDDQGRKKGGLKDFLCSL